MTPQPKALLRFALIALLTVLQLTAPVAAVQAAKFDEKVKVPEAPTNDELKARIRDYFDTYARVAAKSAAGMVRDKAAHAKWFNTIWLLQRAIDTKRDLGDLSEFGITGMGDGSYRTDLKSFPQWSPLDERLGRLLVPSLFALSASDLRERGFRDEDIDDLRTYIERNKPRRAMLEDNLMLGESYAAKVKLQLAKKQKIPTSQYLSFIYQSSRSHAEADRAWAEGLLNTLDKQRQRILESYLMDQSGTRTTSPDDIDSLAKAVIGMIASGEYQQLMEREKMEAQQ